MKRINLCFSILTSIVLASVIVCACAGGIAGGIASGAGDDEASKPAARSYLEGRLYQTMPNATPASLADGSFQSDMEQFFADQVPQRDAVLLANAALQRCAIDIACIPFGFDLRPTFFGSDHLYAASENRLHDFPYLQSQQREAVGNAVGEYNALFALHPEVNWHIAMVNRSATDASSPVKPLVSQPADYQFISNLMQEGIGPRCDFIDLENIIDQENAYFASDHHWQIRGAFAAYERIAASLGIEPIRPEGFFVAYDGPFYGSRARGGLDTRVSDALEDIAYQHGTYKVKINGKKKSMARLCRAFADEPYEKEDTFSGVYGEYFHGDYGLIEIKNEAAPAGALLIVGDSFTNPIERLFAESYQTVYVIDLRHYEGTLSGFLDSHEVDDCVFIMSASDLSKATNIAKLRGSE